MPDFSTAISLLKKPIDELYSFAAGEIKDEISRIRVQSKIKKLHSRLWQSQRVKTIWHTSRPLSLSSFYHPVSVLRLTEDGSTEIKLDTLDDLPDLHNIFFGTVGQGKSILLRYLLGKEIKSGLRIPLLIELRHVKAGELFSYIKSEFSMLLDISNDSKLFEFFAENGKITFLLDGFDEIDSSAIEPIMNEIDLLSAKYYSCRIALTSRPESECKHLTNFYSVSVCPIKYEDLPAFYRRLTRDVEFSKNLIAAISNSPTQIRGLLTTPLLATLLAISYQAAQKIPLDFAEFYDDIFEILLTRHDVSKKGWRRARKTKLNDREMQQAFEAFCFGTRKRKLASFSKEVAYDISKESIEKLKLTADSEGFLSDISNITCLVVPDGKKSTFVHASVQEFFSARFIRGRSEPVAKNFYSTVLNSRIWKQWRQELLFLIQIDLYRTRKYFLIPDLQKTITYLIQDINIIRDSDLDRYLSEIWVKKRVLNIDGKLSNNFYIDKRRVLETYHLDILDGRIFNRLFVELKSNGLPWNQGFLINVDESERTYYQIAADRGDVFNAEFRNIFRVLIENFVKELSGLYDYIQEEEGIQGLVNLEDV